MEWPNGESEPTKYWLSTLPASTKPKELVALAKQRWIIERDYEELKQELGLGHYEGRGWRGFHHHGVVSVSTSQSGECQHLPVAMMMTNGEEGVEVMAQKGRGRPGGAN
jgi:SRSO17 transposase